MDQGQQHWNGVYSPPPMFCDQGPYSFYQPAVPVNLLDREEEEETINYSYDVRIINPKKKSDFVVRRWHDETEIIKTPALLRVKLHESFPLDVPPTTNFKVGYMKGNQKCWIFEERDLKLMYESFKPGSNVTFWCDGIADDSLPSSKRRKKNETPVVSASNSSSSNKENVDQIFKDLKTKHSDMENPKLRLWAKLIDRGRYDDYDNPPQIPLITGSPAPAKKRGISSALVDAATVVANAVTSNKSFAKENLDPPSKLSPLKSAQLRRSCLEDLKSLKDLYQEAVLSEAEFVEEKARIIASLKTL